MSCTGSDTTHPTVNFQRWPLAENSLGGGRGEHQKHLWVQCGLQASSSREEVALTRKRCVVSTALWRIRQSSWAGQLTWNAAPSLSDGWEGGKWCHTCLRANSRDNSHSYLLKYTCVTSRSLTPGTSGHFWQIFKECNYKHYEEKRVKQYLVSIKDTLGRNLFFCINSLTAKGLAFWKASKIHSWKFELLLSVF